MKHPSLPLSFLLFTSLCLLLLTEVTCKDPPMFNYSYYVTFNETYYHRPDPEQHTTAQLFYDPIKKRERIDWHNGLYNGFCNGVFPMDSTPCISLTTEGKRWQIFPEKSVCCLCCTDKRGCGVLRPDWLAGADYQGEVDIDGKNYDKWHIKGIFLSLLQARRLMTTPL